MIQDLSRVFYSWGRYVSKDVLATIRPLDLGVPISLEQEFLHAEDRALFRIGHVVGGANRS